MKSIKVLALLLMAAMSSATMLVCIDGNCTETAAPILSSNFGSIFPFFSQIGMDSDEDDFDEAFDSPQQTVNTSQNPAPQGGGLSFFMEIITFTGGDSQNPEDPQLPQFLYEKKFMFDSIRVLDLSGKSLSGDELASQLESEQRQGQDITTLILSNSQLRDVNTNSFRPVEDTLRELIMDNTSVPLGALSRLSNLKMLNLSNAGLTTFEWYPLLKSSLQVLDLSHNKLEEVRPELSALSNLRELYLSHNRIKSVAENPLKLLPNLEVVSLTHNSLVDATFTSLPNLIRVDLDWNYLWRFGYEAQLPRYQMSLKLASNPWRCDCGMLDAKDNYDVLDIDILQCATSETYRICDDCVKYFLPTENGQQVSNLTKEAIEYLGCTGLTDQYYLVRNAIGKMSEHEPYKLARLGMLALTCILLLTAAVMMCRQTFSKKKFDRKSWLQIQQIPYLKISKFDKPQEVPYVKIDTPVIKA